MTIPVSAPIDVDLGELRQAIQAEYAEVALHPAKVPHAEPPQPPVGVLIAPDRAAAEPERPVA